MNIATLTGLFGFLAATLLLGACQQPSPTGSNPAYSLQQGDDPAAGQMRNCCRRAGRSSGGGGLN